MTSLECRLQSLSRQLLLWRKLQMKIQNYFKLLRLLRANSWEVFRLSLRTSNLIKDVIEERGAVIRLLWILGLRVLNAVIVAMFSSVVECEQMDNDSVYWGWRDSNSTQSHVPMDRKWGKIHFCSYFYVNGLEMLYVFGVGWNTLNLKFIFPQWVVIVINVTLIIGCVFLVNKKTETKSKLPLAIRVTRDFFTTNFQSFPHFLHVYESHFHNFKLIPIDMLRFLHPFTFSISINW